MMYIFCGSYLHLSVSVELVRTLKIRDIVYMQKVQCVVAKLFLDGGMLVLLTAVWRTFCIFQLPLCCMSQLSVVASKVEEVTFEECCTVTDCLLGAR
jgi:hypothetical protein